MMIIVTTISIYSLPNYPFPVVPSLFASSPKQSNAGFRYAVKRWAVPKTLNRPKSGHSQAYYQSR